MLLQVRLHVIATSTILNPGHSCVSSCSLSVRTDRLVRIVCVTWQTYPQIQGRRSLSTPKLAKMHGMRGLLHVARSCRVAHSSVRRRALSYRCSSTVLPINSAASRLSVGVYGSGSCPSKWSGRWAYNGTTPLISFFRGYAGASMCLSIMH